MARLQYWRFKANDKDHGFHCHCCTSLQFCFAFRFRHLVEPCRPMPRLCSGKAFWEGVFSIGFSIHNKSPSSHDMCIAFQVSMSINNPCTLMRFATRRAALRHIPHCRWLHSVLQSPADSRIPSSAGSQCPAQGKSALVLVSLAVRCLHRVSPRPFRLATGPTAVALA